MSNEVGIMVWLLLYLLPLAIAARRMESSSVAAWSAFGVGIVAGAAASWGLVLYFLLGGQL